MRMEEFRDLPHRLEDWTLDTVVNLAKNHGFEPGVFDFKEFLNHPGSSDYRKEYNEAICRTVCSMANTNGGFIIFGVRDRKTGFTVPEDLIVGVPINGELLKEFGEKILSIQPEVYFEAVPQALALELNPANGIFVVRIPKSQRRPHMIYLNGSEKTGIYYRRGEGGSAVPMIHYEVQEQMMYTEDRIQKVNLLRLELAQYMRLASYVPSEIPRTLYRFDVSAFKVLLAEICGLIPSGLFRTMLKVHEDANLINKRLEDIRGQYDGPIITDIQRDLRLFRELCEACERSFEERFGPLGNDN